MIKKRTILLILAVMIGLLFVGSCKRSAINDPDMNRPSGIRISLKGTANPSTLYVPVGEPSVFSLIEVTAINNDGSPARNKEIIFQCGAYGYFEGYTLSTSRWTNDIGKAQIYYYIAAGTDVRLDTQIYLKATLADSYRPIDNSTEIYDWIPINVIPYQQNYSIAISGKISNATSKLGVEGVIVELSTGQVTLTRASGNYSFVVGYGWFGTITPQRESSTFVPDSLTYEEPVNYDLTGQNFYELSVLTLTSDVSTLSFSVGGGSASAYIYVRPDISTAASIIANSSVGWAQVSASSTGPWTNSITGTTPTFIYINVDPNTTGVKRSAGITVISTNPSNMAGSPLTITISQD